MIVDIKLLNIDCMPIKGSEGAVGFDVRANVKEPITIKPGEVKLIPLGFSVDLKEPEIGMMLYMRSGLANKYGLMLTNSVGVIDSDYRGEVMASIWNTGTTGKGFTVEPLDRIGQVVFHKAENIGFNVVANLSDTERGTGGFGSTGI